ncbi:hypothetical protein SAMN05421630_101821 [Prauserella marina]|uniref:Uncharacterized protein n=1 Tax=Prauserella marina TaxID=530584 RepID=A0A1G6JQB1_9PSEU|nr:hypothetical protein DES30_101515 [Prauserella marina]SDC20942.1 hypothetical protein SAMN05421630_101821 [Prauserella marina]
MTTGVPRRLASPPPRMGEIRARASEIRVGAGTAGCSVRTRPVTGPFAAEPVN